MASRAVQEATADTRASGAHTSDLSLSSDRSQGTVGDSQRIGFPVRPRKSKLEWYLAHPRRIEGASGPSPRVATLTTRGFVSAAALSRPF